MNKRAIADTPFAFDYILLEDQVAVQAMSKIPNEHGEVVRVVHTGISRDEFAFGVVHLDFDIDSRDWSEVFCHMIAPEVCFRLTKPSDRITIASAEIGCEQMRVKVEKSGRRLLVTRFRGNRPIQEVEAVLSSTEFVSSADDDVEPTQEVHHELPLPKLRVPPSCRVSPLLMLDGVPTLQLERWIGNELVGRISISPALSLETTLRAHLGGWVSDALIAEVGKKAGQNLVSPSGTELTAMHLSVAGIGVVISSACPGRNLHPGLWMIHRKWLSNLLKQVQP